MDKLLKLVILGALSGLLLHVVMDKGEKGSKKVLTRGTKIAKDKATPKTESVPNKETVTDPKPPDLEE